MQEIEVKVKTKDNDEVIRQLEAAGCVFSQAIEQDDMTYATTKESMDAFMLKVKHDAEGRPKLTISV